MAARKKTTKVVKTEEPMEITEIPTEKRGMGKLMFALAALVIVGFLVYQNRSLFVVALVNNKPIWRPAFESRVLSQVGQKTLDDMVNEEIILSEASRKGISVTSQEIDAEVAKIQKTLPQGTTLDAALGSQGMTMLDLRRQLTLKLTVQKMLTSKAQVTEEEIAKFLEENKEFLTATDEASLRAQAVESLQGEKSQAEFQKLFADLQKKAKVTKFL